MTLIELLAEYTDNLQQGMTKKNALRQLESRGADPAVIQAIQATVDDHGHCIRANGDEYAVTFE